jgi:hypothetical protein
MNIIITGARQAISRMRQIATMSPGLVAGVMLTQAEATMTLAKSLTPVDTGDLRSSGKVDPPSIGMRTVVTMGFHTDYAIYVHEDLAAHHPTGQAKFLETAVNARRSTIANAMAIALKAALT